MRGRVGGWVELVGGDKRGGWGGGCGPAGVAEVVEEDADGVVGGGPGRIVLQLRQGVLAII